MNIKTKILPKNPPKKSSQKNPLKKFLPKNSSKKIPPKKIPKKFPKNSKKIPKKFLRSNSLHRTWRPKTLSGLFSSILHYFKFWCWCSSYRKHIFNWVSFMPKSEMDSMITIRNGSKSYGSGRNALLVLDNLNMTINKGSMWVQVYLLMDHPF